MDALAAVLAERIGNSPTIVRWTPELRERAEQGPIVFLDLEGVDPRGGRRRARSLQVERNERIRVSPSPNGLVTLALVLVHVEGEPEPRWVARERIALRAAPAKPLSAKPPAPIADDATIARFFALTRRADDGCLLWTGRASPKAGGLFRMGARGSRVEIVAHRLALALHNGRWPIKGVRQTCGRRDCVEPTHLREGGAG